MKNRRQFIVGLSQAMGMMGIAPAILRGAAPATNPVTAKPGKDGKKEKGEKKEKKVDPTSAFFDSGAMPTFRVFIHPKDLQKLDRSPKDFVKAQIYRSHGGVDEELYKDVAVHLKGAAGSFRNTGDRPGLTLNMDRFVPDQNFEGLDKFHLNNSVQDPFYMCEYLGSWMFRAAGLPCPRISSALVYLNGRNLGQYVIKEGFDGGFLKTFFGDKSGNIYEGSFRDVDGEMPYRAGEGRKDEKKSPKLIAMENKAARAKTQELADACRDPDMAKRSARIEAVLDVDKFMTFMAGEALVNHWDGYCGNRNNYRIYDDPNSGKLVFLAHGMDQIFQRPDYPLLVPNGMMAAAMLSSQVDRDRFYDRVVELRKTVFNEEVLGTALEAYSKRLIPIMETQGKDVARRHVDLTKDLHNRVTERIKNVDYQLTNRPKPLKFDSEGYAAVSDWKPKEGQGNAVMDEKVEDKIKAMRVVCKSGIGSWRTGAMLPMGKYRIEAMVKTVGVKAEEGPNSGAGLRISGAKDRGRLVGDNAWQKMNYEFEIAEPSREVIFVCELNATKGEFLFDPASFKLRKLKA